MTNTTEDQSGVKAWTPGVYPNVNLGDYLRIDAVNFSTLKHFAVSAEYAHYCMTHPDTSTDALELGEAIHAAMLEPERFRKDYIIQPRPAGHPNSNAYKEAVENWKSSHRENISLNDDEMSIALAFQTKARSHAVVGALLSGPGMNEVAIVWRDPETGILCKARIDRLTKYLSWPTVVDFKSSRHETDHQFYRQFADLQYHVQAAWYLEGLNVLAACERRYIVVACEKTKIRSQIIPELVRVKARDLDSETLSEGKKTCRNYLRQYAKCKETGVWPGAPETMDTLVFPTYAFKHGDME